MSQHTITTSANAAGNHPNASSVITSHSALTTENPKQVSSTMLGALDGVADALRPEFRKVAESFPVSEYRGNDQWYIQGSPEPTAEEFEKFDEVSFLENASELWVALGNDLKEVSSGEYDVA